MAIDPKYQHANRGNVVVGLNVASLLGNPAVKAALNPALHTMGVPADLFTQAMRSAALAYTAGKHFIEPDKHTQQDEKNGVLPSPSVPMRDKAVDAGTRMVQANIIKDVAQYLGSAGYHVDPTALVDLYVLAGAGSWKEFLNLATDNPNRANLKDAITDPSKFAAWLREKTMTVGISGAAMGVISSVIEPVMHQITGGREHLDLSGLLAVNAAIRVGIPLAEIAGKGVEMALEKAAGKLESPEMNQALRDKQQEDSIIKLLKESPLVKELEKTDPAAARQEFRARMTMVAKSQMEGEFGDASGKQDPKLLLAFIDTLAKLNIKLTDMQPAPEYAGMSQSQKSAQAGHDAARTKLERSGLLDTDFTDALSKYVQAQLPNPDQQSTMFGHIYTRAVAGEFQSHAETLHAVSTSVNAVNEQSVANITQNLEKAGLLEKGKMSEFGEQIHTRFDAIKNHDPNLWNTLLRDAETGRFSSPSDTRQAAIAYGNQAIAYDHLKKAANTSALVCRNGEYFVTEEFVRSSKNLKGMGYDLTLHTTTSQRDAYYPITPGKNLARLLEASALQSAFAASPQRFQSDKSIAGVPPDRAAPSPCMPPDKEASLKHGRPRNVTHKVSVA